MLSRLARWYEGWRSGVCPDASSKGEPRDPAPPQVMTMHRAEGMEFSRVVIFGVSGGSVPAGYLLKNLSDADRADGSLRERSLLYVAATWARDELAVLWSDQPSTLLPSG
jgi:superfamily I DNA/RNA helicase